MKMLPAMLGTGKLFSILFLIPHLGIWIIDGKVSTLIIFCLISQGVLEAMFPLLILSGCGVYVMDDSRWNRIVRFACWRHTFQDINQMRTWCSSHSLPHFLKTSSVDKKKRNWADVINRYKFITTTSKCPECHAGGD